MVTRQRGLMGVALAAAMLWSHAAEAQLPTVPIDGLVANRPGKVVGAVEGLLDIREFVIEDGELLARAILNADVLNKAGKRITVLRDRAVSLPVTDLLAVDDIGSGECQVLNLTLGPLDLNILGLIIELDTINLDISADPAGGVLGQLLCGLAGGLDLGLDDLFSGGIRGLVDLLNLSGLRQTVLDLLNSIGGV